MLTCKNCGRQYDRNDHHGCCSSQCFDAWMLKNANTMANIKQAVELSEQTKILREMKAKEEAKERAEIAQQNAIRQQAMINEMQSHGYNDWEKYQKDLAYANRAGYATIEEHRLAVEEDINRKIEKNKMYRRIDALDHGFLSYPEYYAAKLKEQKEYIAHMDETESGTSEKIAKIVASIRKAEKYYCNGYKAELGGAVVIAIIGLLLKKFIGISVLNYGYIGNGIFYFLLFASLFFLHGLILYSKIIKAVKTVRTTFDDKLILLGMETKHVPNSDDIEYEIYDLKGAHTYISWSFTTWMAFILFSIGLFIFHLSIDGLLVKYSIGAGLLFLIWIFLVNNIRWPIKRSWGKKIITSLGDFEKEMSDEIPND